MKNKKGFTLIEMLAVAVILGLVLMISIAGISRYIDRSKRKMYIDIAREYIQITANMLARNDLIARDKDTVYYFDINNLETGDGTIKQSPFGKWVKAYVIVTIKEDNSFVYYWTSVDETGHRIDITEEKNLTPGKIYVTDDFDINDSYPVGGRDNVTIVDDGGNTTHTEPAINVPLDEGSECYEFALNGENTITITNYNVNCGLEVDIPSKIGDYTVTAIGDGAFRNKGIKKVISYAGVRTIGYAAFQGNNLSYVKLSRTIVSVDSYSFYNSKIQELIMPEGIKEIGSYAFANNHICHVDLPSSLTKIGSYAFQSNCLTEDGLNGNPTLGDGVYANNNFPDNNMFVYKTNADGTKDYTTIVAYGGTGTQNLVIPEWKNGYQLKTIASGAFSGTKLKGSVYIPDSVTTLGSSCFYNNSITSVHLPANLVSVGGTAFRSNKLTSIELPEGLKTIGGSAFRGNQLTSVTIPDSVTSIGTGAFVTNKMTGQDGIFYARVADGTTGKGKWDYSTIVSYGGGVSDSTVVIPATKEGVTLKTIKSNAFLDSKVTEVTFPDISETPNLTIEAGAFYRSGTTTSNSYIKNSFAYKVNKGTVDYSVVTDYTGPSAGVNGVVTFPALGPDGSPLKNIQADLTWRSFTTVVIPSSVTTIKNGALGKAATNNAKFTKIINKTGKAFDWGAITSSTTKPQSFETGTVTHQAGSIQVVSE